MVRTLKTLALGLAFGAGSLALVGCTQTSPSGAPTTKDTSKANETMEKMKSKVDDAVKGAVKTTTEATGKVVEKAKEVGPDASKMAAEVIAKAKDAFTKPLSDYLGGADMEIAKLEESAKTAKDDAKKGITDKVANAKDLVAKIKEKIAAIATAPGDKWEALKTEVEKMVNDLKALLPAGK